MLWPLTFYQHFAIDKRNTVMPSLTRNSKVRIELPSWALLHKDLHLNKLNIQI